MTERNYNLLKETITLPNNSTMTRADFYSFLVQDIQFISETTGDESLQEGFGFDAEVKMNLSEGRLRLKIDWLTKAGVRIEQQATRSEAAKFLSSITGIPVEELKNYSPEQVEELCKRGENDPAIRRKLLAKMLGLPEVDLIEEEQSIEKKYQLLSEYLGTPVEELKTYSPEELVRHAIFKRPDMSPEAKAILRNAVGLGPESELQA